MKTIILYGDMRQKFGREFRLDVKTPAEAVRALCSQLKGFRGYLHNHANDAFKVFVGGRNASDEIGAPCSDREVIRIAPVIQGAGAAGRMVMGVVLVALALTNPMGWAAMGSSGAFGLSTMFGMGASMVLGGVVELLSPTTSTDTATAESVTNTPSYNFNGPVNTTAQGHPVPLCYGEMIVGSAVISAGMTTL